MRIIVRGMTFILLFISLFIVGTAQDTDTLAIIPPFLNKEHRSEWENSVQLLNQSVTIFLFQNAAAVYTESDFFNTQLSPLQVELELPSTGYTITDPDGRERDAKELLGVMIQFEGMTAEPEMEQWKDDIWFSIKPILKPNQKTNIKAFFWVPTLPGRRDESGIYDSLEIPRGDRSLIVLLSHASEWYATINNVGCTIVLQDSLAKLDSIFTFRPGGCKITDTSMYWQYSNIEPTPYEDIIIRYNTNKEESTILNTFEALNEYIKRTVYSQLRWYADTRRENE